MCYSDIGLVYPGLSRRIPFQPIVFNAKAFYILSFVMTDIVIVLNSKLQWPSGLRR